MVGSEGTEVDPPKHSAALKNSLRSPLENQSKDEALRSALGVLSEEGNSEQSVEAGRILSEMDGATEVGHQQEVHHRRGGIAAVIWGTVFATDEYKSSGLFIDNLPFGCIDFGGNLKLSTILKQQLRVGEDIETKKCTALAPAAGVEWESQGQPKRRPSRRRIDVMAIGLGVGEFPGAEQAMEQSMGDTRDVEVEIRSICHDALTAEHERDYQALGMFLLPSIRKYIACEVAVVEIRATNGSTFHTYPECPVANETVIFLIAHHGHMMWGKPTASTSCVTWKNRRGNLVTPGSEVVRKVAPWKLRLETGGDELEQTPHRALKPCVRCGLAIKVGLAVLSVGAARSPSNNHSYPKISLEGGVAAEGRSLQPPATPTVEQRMAVSASSGIGTANSAIPTAPSFPIQQVKWRQGLSAAPEAAEYIAMCRRGVTFRLSTYNI